MGSLILTVNKKFAIYWQDIIWMAFLAFQTRDSTIEQNSKPEVNFWSKYNAHNISGVKDN